MLANNQTEDCLPYVNTILNLQPFDLRINAQQPLYHIGNRPCVNSSVEGDPLMSGLRQRLCLMLMVWMRSSYVPGPTVLLSP